MRLLNDVAHSVEVVLAMHVVMSKIFANIAVLIDQINLMCQTF